MRWGLVAMVQLGLLATRHEAGAAGPLSANGVFVSRASAFTFQAPPGLTYCPLPDGWTGSDHGTILFLTPPTACDGAGYPSSSRGFAPERTPRIEVYYGRWEPGDVQRARCHPIGRARFLGRLYPLCRSASPGVTTVTVTGFYTADSMTQATVSLSTTPNRLRHDLLVLKSVLATARPCSVPWQDADGRQRIEGSGPRCAAEGDFY